MKKLLCIFLVISIIFSFNACSTQKNKNSSLSKTSQKATENSLTEDNKNAKECYEKILKNEQVFYSINNETDIILSDYNKKVWQYSFVDMDTDNIDELAIMFEDGSVLLLRKDGTTVIGFDFGLRGMSQIYTDGSFLWNRDDGNTYGCSKLEFTGKTYKVVELWRVENNDSGSEVYYIDGKIATKEEFDSFNDKNNPKSINWNLLSSTTNVNNLTLEEAFENATKQFQQQPKRHRNLGELQSETQGILLLNDKFYQSYISDASGLRYIFIHKSEYPMSANWDWVPIGTANTYSLELLGKIDEGYK